jgi:hypothetical protein
VDDVPSGLTAALQPVLKDLEVVQLRPRISGADWGGPEQLSAMSWWPDGSGVGVWVLSTCTACERIAMLAEQIQEAAVEVLPGLGRPAIWPKCPDHPNSHPLQARCVDETAVWVCARSDRQVAEIGALAAT